MYSCDFCGCYFGITPYDNQSQIGFFHRYRVFNGYREYKNHSVLFPTGAYKTLHGGANEDSLLKQPVYLSSDFESYKVYELRLKAFLFKRFELNALVPFIRNRFKYNNLIRSTSGISDPTFFFAYHILRRIDTVKFQQRLIAGGGVKIPSGHYYLKDENAERLPLELQPGTGTVDWFLYLNYIFSFKKIGFNVNEQFRIPGKNYFDEQYCNSYNGFLSVFLKMKLKNVFVFPSIQVSHEFSRGLKVKEILQDGTAINTVMIGPGLDLNYKNLGIYLSYHQTLLENQFANSLKGVGRLSLGLVWNFNQRKFIK